MRTEQAQPVRLADYRVPDYLIDTVDLDVRLARHADARHRVEADAAAEPRRTVPAPRSSSTATS